MSSTHSDTPGSFRNEETGIPKRSNTSAWLLLLIASVFEIIFALATNATDGFTRLWPSLLVVLAAGSGIFFLSTALRQLDVGVGYTVWIGIGSVGTVALGAVLFDEELSTAKLLCFVLIIGGIITLQLTNRNNADENQENTDAT